MKIPAILLFLLLWSIASCNLANRKSSDESGGQATFERQNDIENSDGSETLPDGWHRTALPKDGMSNDCDGAAKGSNVDEEVTMLDTDRHDSGKNQNEGRPRLSRQKAAGLSGYSGKRTKTKGSSMKMVPSATVRDQEFANDMAEAIGKVVLKHMLKKYMSSVSLDSVTHVPNEMQNDRVKNSIDRVGKVTSPLNNVPLISGEKGVDDDEDDEDGDDDGTKTGPKLPKTAVAEIGRFETPPATGVRKEDATKGGMTSELVKPLSPVGAPDCADESKKGPSSRTKSTVQRFSNEDAGRESAIEDDENAPAARRGSRQKRSLFFGQTYGNGADPRLRNWQGLKKKFAIGRDETLSDGTAHNNPVTVNDAVDWRQFSLDDLLYGDKTPKEKLKPSTFRIYNWGEDTSKDDTSLQPWSKNQFLARSYRFDRSGLNDIDTRFLFNKDYTPSKFRTYSWDVGKQEVEGAERQNKQWNFGTSHGENEENRFVYGNKWNTRRLYQPQTGRSDEQQSDIGTRKNKLSNQRSLYQFSIGSGTLVGKDQKNEKKTNIDRFESTTVSNKYQVTPLPTIGTMTFGMSEAQGQNNAKTANINRFQSATKDQVGAFRISNQKSKRTKNANRFDFTTIRNKYQISSMPTIGTYTSERPQMKNQKYVASTNTHRFQSVTPANNYHVPQLATISSNAEKSKKTHKKVRYNHHGGSYDLDLADVNYYYINPKTIYGKEFLTKRHGSQKTEDSTASTKNAYKVSNSKHNQEIAATAATKIGTETNVKEGKRPGKKSAKATSVGKSNLYDMFVKKAISGRGTGRLYRYNHAGKSHGTAIKKTERNDLTGKGLVTWNAKSNGAQSDAATHTAVSSRGMHFNKGQSKGSDVSTNTRVTKFGVQTGRSRINRYLKHWRRPSTTKTATKAVNKKQGRSNVRKKYNFSSKKSKSGQSVQKETSSESAEFQFIPLVLTPMGTPTRRSRGRSTIKNQRIYYDPDELFKMYIEKETAKKTSSQSDDSGISKSKKKSQPTTSGTTSIAYARWRNNNKNIKNDRPANKNPSRKSDSSIADASGETYNRIPLILTAVPTSKSYVPIRGVKNKRISTDAAEDTQTDFDNRFGGRKAAEGEDKEKIRGTLTKGNYRPSKEISEVINYGKDNQESSPKQSGKFGKASAASSAGSYRQSHVESAELSKSRAVAADKGSRVKDSSGATIEKGTKQKDGNAGKAKDNESSSASSVDFGTESKGVSASDRGKATYNGIRKGELFEERQLGQISRPFAVAAANAKVTSADIESSSGSSKGFAGSAAYNGNAAKGSSDGPRRSKLRSTSSAASGARDETVERETSGDKLAGLSGRTDSVSAGEMGRVERIEDASANSMARDKKDEEWGSAKRIFAYRKYMAEGHGEEESWRLADRQLVGKYSGAGAKLHAGGVHGPEKNGRTYVGGAESRSENSANGKRGQNEFHGGKSAEASAVSGNSNMAMGTNKKKTGLVGASAEAAGEKMSVKDRMEDSSGNENSASTEAHGELTSHKTKTESEVDKSAKKYLSGEDSRTHEMKEHGSNEKQRSSGINIAGGETSADASEKFREENSEWLVGESGNGWHRRGALVAHDKGAARAAESALSDKSPAESSAYGKLASNEIRGKSATEISGVSVKSGASAESGRYTEKLSDASLKDSTRVTNGIRRANGNAAEEAESMSVDNLHGGNSMEGVNELGHGSNGEALLISNQVLAGKKKNMADKVDGVMVGSVNNGRAKELKLMGASSESLANGWSHDENSKHGLTLNKWSSKPSHAFSHGSNEKASLVSEQGSEMTQKNMANKVSGAMVESVNSARAKESDLMGASSESSANGWSHDEYSKHELISKKWWSKSSHAFSHGSNEKASLVSEQGSEMSQKNMANKVSGAMVESVNSARAKESNLMGASSESSANGWSHGEYSKHGLISNKWSSKSSDAFSHGSNEKASLMSEQGSDMTQKNMANKVSSDMVESVNSASAKESNLMGASSESSANGWSQSENSKHGLTSNKWSPKSSHAFGSADASADVESGSVNIKGLDSVKGANSYDKSSSDSFANNQEHGESRGNGLQQPPTSLHIFGATRSHSDAESKSNIQRLNVAHAKELGASSDSSAFANTRVQSDIARYGAPPNKLPSSPTFGTTKSDVRAASEGKDKNSMNDLLKSSPQPSTFDSLQNKMQSDQSNHVLSGWSGADAEAVANERNESNESGKAGKLSIKDDWSNKQSLAIVKSDTETLSGTESKESQTKNMNRQDIRKGQSKPARNKLSGEPDEQKLEHNLGSKNDLTSAEHSYWQIPKKSSTFANAKADVEIISTGSPKNDIEIIVPTKETSKSGASHELLVNFKGDNEIHDTDLATKQPSASSSSPADSLTYSNGELSEDRYKWKFGASKIPPPTATSHGSSAVVAESSASAGSQAKTFAHGQLIGDNLLLEKSGINQGPPPPMLAKDAATNSEANSNSAAGKNVDNRPGSSSGSGIESISSSDATRELFAGKSSGRSFAKLPEASSVASAGTQGKAAANAYSISATESGASSKLPGQAGAHGMDKHGSGPKSSSSAFASSSGSWTNPAKPENSELSDVPSAASVASGEGLAGWSSVGLRNGEAPQAKQSPLSAKSHAGESSEHVDKLGEFNSKKLTDEFTAVSPGSSSSGPTEKVGAGAERSTAKSFATQKVADDDRGRIVVSDKAESMSSADSNAAGTKHGLEGKHLGGGYGEKLFRDHDMATDNFGGKSGLTEYAEESEKSTGGSGLMKSSNLGYDASQSDESNISRVPEKYKESDFGWGHGKAGAKNVRGFKYGSGNEGKGASFMKGMSGAMSQAKINEKDRRFNLLDATAYASSTSGSLKSLEGMKFTNKETKKVAPSSLEADEYKILMKTDSKAEASANAVDANTIKNRKQVLAETDLNKQNINVKSSAAEKLKLTQIQNSLPKISEFRSKIKPDTEVGAYRSSWAESSTTAAGQGKMKEDSEGNVLLNESQAKAAAHGSLGNDKLSGKKFAGKLIDASSQVAAGAGSQHHEFDGKGASPVVSDMERTESIAGTKSMSSAEGNSPSDKSGDKEGTENKSAESLFHSKVSEDLRDKSASQAVSGKLISAADSKAASAEAGSKKKWPLAESDTISSELRRLTKMRNKLAASEKDLSSLSIVKNEGAAAELINGKWSAASGGVLAKSRVDAVGVGKSSISSEAGESSESDSGALLRSMGGDKLREREEIDELADATAASAASGKANSKIASGHVGQQGSGSSRLTSIRKSGALGGREVYATTSDVNAQRDSSARTAGYSSVKSERSEALDMLTNGAESSAGLDKSNAKSSAGLVGPKSSYESQADKKAESDKKGTISSSRHQSAKLLHPPPTQQDKSQKLTLTSMEKSNYIKSSKAEASHDKVILHNEPGETTIHTKSSDTSAKASAENYGGANDVGGKLAGKWTVGSASLGKSAARADSSDDWKSSSHAVQGGFNMQASSESADSLKRDALSSDWAINGKWRLDGSAEASSKSSAADRGQGLSAGTGWSSGNAGEESVSASAASSVVGVESSGELRMRDNDDAGKELKMKGMNSEGKNKNARGEWGEYALGEWEEWMNANEWKENQEWWVERLKKQLVSSSGEKGTRVGVGKSDEQTNEGLMFISYDSLGRASVQEKNVNKGGQVGGSGEADDESFVNLAEWTNGDFDRKKVRKGKISGLLPHESSDRSEQREKSPHAAVIVPLTTGDWWSKQDGVMKNAGRDGKPSLFKFLGRQEENWPEGNDESERNDKFMSAEVVADSTETEPDSKDLQKGKRIELIPVKSTDSDQNSERKDDVIGISKPESKDKHTDKKKKCVKLYTVPPDNTSGSEERVKQFVKGVSYEFESDSPSPEQNNDKSSGTSDQIRKKQNPKKPYKICLDLDSSDNTNEKDMDKPRTEIFVVQWTSQGPVKVAKIEDKVKPAVIYKLLSRHIYEKIRNLLAHN